MNPKSGIVFALFSILLFSSLASALSVSPSYPYPGGTGSTQTSVYYNVLFDDRGQSTVALALDYFHLQDSNLEKITIDIPGKSVTVKFALQTNSNNYYYAYPQYDGYGKEIPQDSRYYGPQWIDVEKVSANAFTLHLPKTVSRGENTTILLYYKTQGYAENGLTGTSFDFPTPKFSFDVDSSRVSVGVDQGLILKEGETKSDYIRGFGGIEAMSASGASRTAVDAGATNQSIQSIRYASGGLVKTKNNLNAGEAFHVTGNYSKSWIALFWMESLGIIIALLVVLFLLGKFVWPKIGKWMGSSYSSGGNKMAKNDDSNFGRAALFGFVASAGYALVTVIATIVAFTISALLNRGSYYAFNQYFEWISPWELLFEILFLAGVFAVSAKKSNFTEAVIASMVFFAASLILVPIAFIITALITTVVIQLLAPPVIYY